MPKKSSSHSPAVAALRPVAEKERNVLPGGGERRLITALSYDLVGSTGLLAQSDVEDFDELI